MLNTKYIMEADDQRRVNARVNPKVLGNAWFVDNIKWVENADEEIDALMSFNPANTAIIDEKYKDYIPFDVAQGNSVLSSIQLKEYLPNKLTYRANVLGDESLAVFSEIYYEGGDNDWKVYIDGIETSHIRVNYILRALAIPQGEHNIEFKFLPSSYFTGEKISLASSFLLIILIFGTIGWEIKKARSQEIEVTPKDD
ncbi:MAG: hypothetical protein IH948_05710 [Bacteroidetes bacterium]|nr:hypothetical protein [Bacteroidota bacterium]